MGSPFPPAVRLRKRFEFEQVFQASEHRSSDRYFTVLGRFHVQGARLGLVVAKKNARRAHERNRIKRCIRESFRLHRHDLPTYDLIVMARHAAAEASNQQLRQSLEHHWQQLPCPSS